MSLDPLSLIKSLGYLGVWGILFAESGILMFFFLPGDSLLFTAGFLASQGYMDIGLLVGGGIFAAVTGNMLGYEVGRRFGLRLFKNGDTRFLKVKHLEMTQRFYEKHGRMTIIMARFLPIIRTFAPFLAGVAGMPYKRFLIYTIIGALAWVGGLCLFGLLLGNIIPPDHIDRYLLPIIIGIIVLSLLPSFYHIYKEYKLNKA